MEQHVLEFRIWWEYHGLAGNCSFTVVGSVVWDESLSSFYERQRFWIFEGNYACDCNRSMLVGLADEFAWDCGNEIVFREVAIYIDGELAGVHKEDDTDVDKVQ